MSNSNIKKVNIILTYNIICILLYIIVFAIAVNAPSKEVELIFKIIKNVIATLILLSYLFIKSIRWYNLFYVSIIPIMWVTLFFFESKIDHIIYIIYFSIEFIICIMITFIIKKTESYVNMVIFFVFVFIVLIINMEYLRYLNYNVGTSLLCGLVIGVIISLLCLPIIIKAFSSNGIKTFIGMIIFTIIISGMMGTLIVMDLNHTFDFKKPVVEQYKVVEKEIRPRRKAKSGYIIYYMVDGKKEEIEVSSIDYYKIHENGYINIGYFEGFLKIEYQKYLSE